MTLPKPFGLTALTAGLFLTASTALAQTISFEDIDTIDDDADLLTSEELIAAFGSDDLLRFDMDDDGALSLDELRAATDDDDDDDDGDFELDGNDNLDTDGNNGHGNSGGYDPSNPGKSQEDGDDGEDDEDDEEEEEQDDEDDNEDGGNQGRSNRGGNN